MGRFTCHDNEASSDAEAQAYWGDGAVADGRIGSEAVSSVVPVDEFGGIEGSGGEFGAHGGEVVAAVQMQDLDDRDAVSGW